MIANNDGWIEWTWTEEKPYPETLETEVVVMFRDGTCAIQYSDTVRWWHEATVTDSSWFQKGDLNEIVAYRVVN